MLLAPDYKKCDVTFNITPTLAIDLCINLLDIKDKIFRKQAGSS